MRTALPLMAAIAVSFAGPARSDDYSFMQRVELGSFELAGGASHGFGVGLGGTPLGVVGFSVEFDYSEPVSDGSLASDLRVIITAPDRSQYSVGGLDTPSDALWSFQGPASDGPGHYGDDPADLFLQWKEDPQPNQVWLGELVNDRGNDVNPNLYGNVVVFFYINPCPADLNNDDVVDVQDLVNLIQHWGPCEVPVCAGDINHDRVVGVADLVELILAWGACD